MPSVMASSGDVPLWPPDTAMHAQLGLSVCGVVWTMRRVRSLWFLLAFQSTGPLVRMVLQVSLSP